jgi:phage terminase large subunit-like protein
LRGDLSRLTDEEFTALLEAMTPEARAALLSDWTLYLARDNQLPPEGDWRVCCFLAGRGWGKTRVGAEWVHDQAAVIERIALVAPTAADVRDVMIEGESGIMATARKGCEPKYEPSKRRLTWPNGAIATAYSADEPDRLRGPQHGAGWADEVAAWKYPGTWDMLLFGMRLGHDPRIVVTTTPKQVPHMKAIKAAPNTVIVRGKTRDNAANLAEAFLTAIVNKFEGTRLGRQELDGEDLEDNPGALWKRGNIDEWRVVRHPDLVRVVVGVDPAATSGADSDETGIVVAGVDASGRYYVIEDASLKASPDGWGRAVVTAYAKLKADRILAEANNGGEMVEHVIRTVDPRAPVKLVHASRGKVTRAEPIAALYEQGKVSHVGSFALLEDQMCQWEPGQSSPDRLDALVWALTDLSSGRVGGGFSFGTIKR